VREVAVLFVDLVGSTSIAETKTMRGRSAPTRIAVPIDQG